MLSASTALAASFIDDAAVCIYLTKEYVMNTIEQVMPTTEEQDVQELDVMRAVAHGYNEVVVKVEQVSTVGISLAAATPRMWAKSRKATNTRMASILADILG